MRIEPNGAYKISQKQEESQHPSGKEIVKQIQSQMDLFETNARGASYEDIVNHFTSPPSKPPLPEIVGKANAPEIDEEALEKLRQQLAAEQNKSDKKA